MAASSTQIGTIVVRNEQSELPVSMTLDSGSPALKCHAVDYSSQQTLPLSGACIAGVSLIISLLRFACSNRTDLEFLMR